MRVAGESGMLTLVHCEDAASSATSPSALVAEGRGDLSNYAEARPVFSERVAVVRAIGFAEAAGAPIYIVHLSSADALAEAHAAHARGLPVYVETRPMYLHLTAERLKGPDGPLYVGQPPLREQRDQDALWNGLRAADVHTCCCACSAQRIALLSMRCSPRRGSSSSGSATRTARLGDDAVLGENIEALFAGMPLWAIAPGLCIALLGAAFALLNYAFDEISSPALRVRKLERSRFPKTPPPPPQRTESPAARSWCSR